MIEPQQATIFALSSGRPPAGIAIVRLSGPRAFAILESLTIGSLPPLRQLAYRRIVDRDGDTIDKAMIVRFAAPASATGEDLVEFHLHGGVAVVAAMLKTLARFPDVILAERGDFARRSFNNGRLNLEEVENLADLINAETESQRRLALSHIGTELHQYVDNWRSTIIGAQAEIAANLDFADEEDVQRGGMNSNVDLLNLRNQLVTAIADMRRANMIRDGLTIALVGPVNTGKSSLINRLAARDVAIVNEAPGTTRDVIEVNLVVDGMVFTILDTAGIRSSLDAVEIEGIRRGQTCAANADLVIAVGNRGVQAGLHVTSKCDQLDVKAGWHDETLYVSSVTGEGIDLLLAWLAAWAQNLVRPGEPVLIKQYRHVGAVEAAIVALNMAVSEDDIILKSEHLKAVATALDCLVGRIASDDILDAIFDRFCIGK